MNPDQPLPPRRTPASPRGPSRAYTLVELMTVVVIIGIFAAMALPSVANQLRERKSANVAQQLTQFYRTARMRAMGRGSAVLVRYDSDGAKLIAMREAIAGVAGMNPCELAPISSCTMPASRWDDPTAYRQLDLIKPFDNTVGTQYEVTRMQLRDSANTVKTKADICFTPGGRAFYRETFGAGLFTSLNHVPSVRVYSMKDGMQVGPDRFVYVLPNGIARIGK